jgi:hypothetical protein
VAKAIVITLKNERRDFSLPHSLPIHYRRPAQMNQNPILIQRHHYRKNFTQKAPPEPLFLIHDGGGTVFSYFLLGSLGRTVYGISNPSFETELTWANGIASMAEYYVKLIKATCPSGDILLGGRPKSCPGFT